MSAKFTFEAAQPDDIRTTAGTRNAAKVRTVFMLIPPFDLNITYPLAKCGRIRAMP